MKIALELFLAFMMLLLFYYGYSIYQTRLMSPLARNIAINIFEGRFLTVLLGMAICMAGLNAGSKR